MTGPTALVRRLGLLDATVLGLGSMIGAGVFVVLAPAARAAGQGLMLGLAVAAVVALANATSSAQLAAQYPTSGGTYVYGRERLGAWAGFFAGWSFVVGKTASMAAMAMTVAAYAVPAAWQRPVAVGAVVGLAAVGYAGLTRTAALTRVLVAVVLAVLVAVLVAAARVGGAAPAGIGPGWRAAGVLQAAGFWFFAFAGYARIATLGEEVRDPRRTIPRAIVLALGLTLVVYAALAVAGMRVLGVPALAASTAPVHDLAVASGAAWLPPLVQVAAVLAALGALAALLAGISRTVLAMAREGDLPRVLAAVHPRFGVPHRAELVCAGAAVVLVLVVDLRSAIGFSSFGVLLYYAVANAAALTQDRAHRRQPRALAVLGLVGCLALVVTLPRPAVLGGLVVLLSGLVWRLTVGARSRRRSG